MSRQYCGKAHVGNFFALDHVSVQRALTQPKDARCLTPDGTYFPRNAMLAAAASNH